ncbi:carboxymuconolactone decarboxylase family protein [Pseudomonas sp. GD03746]|uniref:carboxymuconolactone decarboxylase family protein n=1 Tax=Pseudomonas sp. GD03746 TaxID=2975378 RepID=UPI002448CB9D|nr:carboxymuconolactone decarboxylase family protein [Pseudomonas sp. GD03746]MDH1572093.1 carboxymuconolactone decarboxylase family protein [Pseudomonas sp. GD03746]HEN8711927.1 carboxymuconolactone decarboxylase family protein [Pseudomonas putida]HEN8716205.1 carboxymuconolactone decarboxylase family protein [Pseudomonas putida]
MKSDKADFAVPAFVRYTQDVLLEEIWQRPQLLPRDRSLVTVAALIALHQPAEMVRQFDLALDNGVTPTELSEVITHLAFYSGWGSATLAASIAKDVFEARDIARTALADVQDSMLPVDETFEQMRVAAVEQMIGPAFEALAGYTTSVLFHDLWLRPTLTPRDRCLVTVAALVAVGQAAQIPFHVNKAMDNGLTQIQAAEVITHLAFYAGWPNAMSAAAIAKGIFEKRSE